MNSTTNLFVGKEHLKRRSIAQTSGDLLNELFLEFPSPIRQISRDLYTIPNRHHPSHETGAAEATLGENPETRKRTYAVN